MGEELRLRLDVSCARLNVFHIYLDVGCARLGTLHDYGIRQ